MKVGNSIYTVQIVTKAFELLELLSAHQGPADLPHLAAKAGMTRNKAFRILMTLCEKGLIERDEVTGCYELGYSSVSLAQKMLKHSSVINLAHPVMENLARRHDEAVYMTVIKGDDVLFLDMVDCEQQIKAVPLVGRKFPFFTNASGKVIKALESRELIEWLSSKKQGKAKKVPDPEKLASELLVIRANGGVATDCNGLGDGINSVAVAIKDYAGKVIGAITLLAPSFRMVQERMENEIVPSLTEAAALISQKFGYTPCATG
ncbi:IclR family transcriptional regulator [Geobacter sp. SVR]|uniref:IclR family transcriptional regulator n=1 Tax=Geobacter sp. SVR TaxID=2495594 RepID=UPI00143F02A1|nr:IclR family transcriptional regulator [Geobacter sp. SVR]BCS52516.1 IclR family transcriptional regulator [Geobacter sp. SVR]GCF84047.1 IclR family transcriptional regulator [Geobacter sp. SVR]